MIKGFIILGVAVVFNGVANILMKKGMTGSQSDDSTSMIKHYLTSWPIIIGLVLFALNVIAYTQALARIPLSVAYPIMVSVTGLIVVAGSMVIFKESIGWLQWLGFALIIGGVVLVNHEECIGCKACIASCPYDARYVHPEGYVDKCTFCIHRVEDGLDPACVSVCPTHCMHFGDLDDPNSDVNKAIDAAGTAVFRLKTEAGTNPKVFYLGEPPSRDARLVENVPVAEGIQQEGDPAYDGGTVPWK